MDDFEKASKEALEFLRNKLGFQLCMVTIKEGKNWTVLHRDDVGYGIDPGHTFNWEHSFCCQMVEGNGPRISADASQVPAYAAAEIGKHLDIGAYVGVPLISSDGQLFGTLCGMDPETKSENLLENQGLVELVGSMLSTILQVALRADEEEQKAERYQAQAMTDELTGLYNRAGWNLLLAKEESRYERYRHSSIVIAVDLDGLKSTNDELGHEAGDALIKKAAKALLAGARGEDIVARLGGDEFGIIGINCDLEAGLSLCARLQASLEAEGVKASFGIAQTNNVVRLKEALHQADQAMYVQKRERKTHS